MQRSITLGLAAILSILLGPSLPVARAQAQAPNAPKPIEVKVPVRKDKAPVSYAREVAEVLENKCVGCHGSGLAESKLNMEEVAGMIKGGKHGPSIVPGKADASLLFQMAAHRVEPAMPPRDKPANKPMTPDELGILKLWIDAGARDDSAEQEKGDGEKAPKPVVLGELPPGVHPINAVDLTADGKRVAVGRANVVQVYDVETGRELISLGGHKDLIQSVRFSPDGSILAAGSYQIVTLWNVPKAKPPEPAPPKPEAAKAPTKPELAKAPPKPEATKNPAKPEMAKAAPAKPEATKNPAKPELAKAPAKPETAKATIKPEAAKAETAKATIKPADSPAPPVAENWTLRTTLGPHIFRVLAIDFSPDGTLIATGGGDPSRSGELRLWEAKKGMPVHSFDQLHSDTIFGLRFSPDGSKLATASADKFVKVVDVPARKFVRLFEGHTNHVMAVDWKSDGKRLVSGGADNVLKVWDTDTGDVVKTIAAGGKPVTSARWIAGKPEVLAATGDSRVKIWNPEGTGLSKDFSGPNDYVYAVAASADGSRIAAGGSNGILFIWDGKTGKVLRKLEPAAAVVKK